MPPNLDSADKLFMKHSSKPYNPKLANVFFKSGMIEAWGRGFEKIKEACGLYDGPLPEYEINEAGIMVLCKACNRYLELLSTKEKRDSIISDERIMNKKVSELRKEPIIKIVNYLKENEEITTAKGIEITGKSEAQVRRYLKALCDLGIIKRTRTTKGNVYLRV
jgi:ATP-dependent DNA helicase RecG